MTQNNERELIERLALVDIDLRRSHNGFDFIASLSELEAFAKAYKTASDANDESPISQNEQQEPIALLALKNTELNRRIEVLEDLLASAAVISLRRGEDTHWDRFIAQLKIKGICFVTPKTFKILPSDEEYTSPTKQIPEGWKLVPIAPTSKMIDAAWDDIELMNPISHNQRNKLIYKAMLNAAPNTSETNTEVGND